MIGRRKSRTEDVEVSDLKSFDDFALRLGDMMRGERATLGKSLLDVQRELKIKAAYISAIENCDPDVFETPGFIAGYVRSYARYLGMDPEMAFDTFCAESGFSTAHGMSEDASTIKKSRAAEIIASSSVGRDPFAQPSTPFIPAGEGLMSRVEPGAVGSTLVLLTLLGAIGFGGWTVLNEVQQVRVAPVDETPVVLTDLDPIANATRTSALASASDGTLQTAPLLPGQDGLDRLYRPKALDTPVLIARDAPISMIDPRNTGSFATAGLSPQTPRLESPNLAGTSIASGTLTGTGDVIGSQSDLAELIANSVVVPQVLEQVPDQVQLVAVRPAWVRVRAADGTTVFSGILDAGDTYPIPVTEDPANLRVGESGAIYFAVNGQHYGPVGPNGQVTSNVMLSANDVTQTYAVADLTQDQDLARMVAELQGLTPPAE
jgi:hypothetical protein